jgi:hypothetical protein
MQVTRHRKKPLPVLGFVTATSHDVVSGNTMGEQIFCDLPFVIKNRTKISNILWPPNFQGLCKLA